MKKDKQCEKCPRPGILVCQYVIPNQWSKDEQKHIFAPWVFRYHLCRWHLAAENNPRHWDFQKKRLKLEHEQDESLIAKWHKEQSTKGQITEDKGWQKPALP